MTRSLIRTAPLACVLLLTGCATGVTFDEAFGRPDAADWTYFEASPGAVVEALVDVFQLEQNLFQLEQNLRVESIQDDRQAGGTLLTVSSRSGTPDYNRILVQRSPVEGYGSRAQIYPRQDPLPRDLELAVSGRSSGR